MFVGLPLEANTGGASPRDDSPAQGMAELLQGEGPGVRSIQRGDIIDGMVMKVDRDSILVDIGSKTEGVIPGYEMRSLGSEGLSQVKVGDEILVYVLQPENREGQVVLSLDRATGEGGWRILQQRFDAGEIIEAEVAGYNRGGLLVNIDGVRGFVPISQVMGLRGEVDSEEEQDARFAKWIGTALKLKIIELNRRRNRLILSERVALQEWRNQQRERLLEELREGDIREGTVTSIREFGVFVDLGGADGLVHLSELSWGKAKAPQDMVSPGDKLNVYVLKVDSEKRKIALSLKRAQPDAWEEVAGRYEPGQMVTGTITKLTNFGAFAHIEGPVEGLIHISELAERRIPHPKEVVKEGDVLTLKILRIDREHYRLGLSLKQALGELENLEQNRVHRQMEAMNQVASESPTLGDMADPESLEALVRMVRADDITVAETALEEETDSSAGDENASDPPVQV